MFRRLLTTSLSRTNPSPPLLFLTPKPLLPKPPNSLSLLPNPNPNPNPNTNRFLSQMSSSSRIPSPSSASRSDLLRSLESSLGSAFSSSPLCPSPSPLIIVISGPSGVGKDALISSLRLSNPNLHFVVTATTRPIRPGETHGRDYFFLSKDHFLSMIKADEFLEYALVYGDYKGIPKQQIREYMGKGYDIVLRVDIQGAETLRRILGESAVFIFLVAESEAKLVERLVDRKTETKESLLVRVATAREEVKHVKNFDYVVVNAEGRLDSAVELVESIIRAEKARVQQRRSVI